MNQPPIFSLCRVFPLRDKRARIRWKDEATTAAQFDWSKFSAYGLIADGFAVIDFDDQKSRAIWPEGNLAHFCALDGLTVEELIRRAPVVKTPHGFHLIVDEDEAIDQNQGFRLPDGTPTEIDVRAHGKGYIVGPGSSFRSDRDNAAAHPDEPVGTILRYQPLFYEWPRKLPSLQSLLPSVYSIVTAQNRPSLGFAAPVSIAQNAEPQGIRFSPEVRHGAFDGSHNWIPRDWKSGLSMMRTAEKGTRHWIMIGCARYLWRYRNRSQFDAMLAEYWDAARETGYPDRDIQHILDDFVGAKIERDQSQVLAAVTARTETASPDQSKAPQSIAPEPSAPSSAEPKFILSRKGDEIVLCEENLRLAIRSGKLKVDDFVIDFRGELVHLPSRAEQKEGKLSAHSASYEATAVLVGRIDRFFGGSMRTRSVFLPIAIDEIGKVATESLAPEFFAAITSPGSTASTEELVRRMGVDPNPQVVRWVEACLLQSLRRMLRPAAPLENILLLWGPQRTRKSTFVPSLFDPSYLSAETGEYEDGWSYTDTLAGDLKDEQAVGQRVKSKFALEIPELTAFRRTKDIGALRDVITRTHDSYRAPYAKKPEKQPRTCTFVGTSNEEPELGDQYGNRRFCVVNVRRPIDTSWIVEHRVEIWRGLYQTLKASPKRAVLSAEEQAEKEKSLETNAFLAIPYFAEICDALKQIGDSTSNEVLPLTDILRELTTEKEGPHLPNTELVRRAVYDILRHLGAKRRPGRYPTFTFGAMQRETLALWMSADADQVTASPEPSAPEDPIEAAINKPIPDDHIPWSVQCDLDNLRKSNEDLLAENVRLQNELFELKYSGISSPEAKVPENATEEITPPPPTSPIAPEIDRYSPVGTVSRLIFWWAAICAEYSIAVPQFDTCRVTTWRAALDRVNKIIVATANARGPDGMKREILTELQTRRDEIEKETR